MSDNVVKKKKVFFIAVTDKENSRNRAYSNFMYLLCKKVMIEDEEISKKYDADNFVRHDMLPAGNLYDSVFESLIEYDAFIVLIDKLPKGYNPNVWFEMGIASTLEKPMILIGRRNNNLPFHANVINVLGLEEELFKMFLKDEESFRHDNSMEDAIRNIFNNQRVAESFSKRFVQRFLSAEKKGNPFKSINDELRIREFGYGSLTKLFTDSDIINLIKNPDVHAEYIAGEKKAFEALTKAVEEATDSVRTTRFANQSIVKREQSEKEEIFEAHKNFMQALYKVSQKESIRIFDRIVCNNNPFKWFDIAETMLKSSPKLNLYIRKANYNINFELVVIDERVAFIHFYQTSKSGDVDDSMTDNENRHDFENQRIKSTLKITGKSTCRELAKIFDRLHHRDFDSKEPENLSRTLLGVESTGELTDLEKQCGRFSPQETTLSADADLVEKIRRTNSDEFIEALKKWNISGQDKINMVVGLCLAYGMRLDDLRRRITFSDEDKKLFNETVEKYELATRIGTIEINGK